jgi:hypothetical protein
MFQHDNARHHVVRICTQFLGAENVSVLPWPAYSPDIEHVWIDAYDSVFQFLPISNNFAAIEEEWDNNPQATINSLINSVKEMHEANGSHTRFGLVF